MDPDEFVKEGRINHVDQPKRIFVLHSRTLKDCTTLTTNKAAQTLEISTVLPDG
jgi:hypothetical protein